MPFHMQTDALVPCAVKTHGDSNITCTKLTNKLVKAGTPPQSTTVPQKDEKRDRMKKVAAVLRSDLALLAIVCALLSVSKGRVFQ